MKTTGAAVLEGSGLRLSTVYRIMVLAAVAAFVVACGEERPATRTAQARMQWGGAPGSPPP